MLTSDQKRGPWRGYYLTAYGIAVKHGFVGTEVDWLRSLTAYGIALDNGFEGSEEEWLLSLKGDPGEPVELRYNDESDTIEWKLRNEEEWQELMSLAAFRGDVVQQTLDKAKNYATAAESWAVGGTGTRDDEDTNNSRYWAQIARDSAGVGASVTDITIPTVGWKTNAIVSLHYPYYVDVLCDEAKSNRLPVVMISPADMDTAFKASICPTVESFDRYLRFRAKQIPEKAIGASASLFNAYKASEEHYVLPVADEVTLGGIKESDSVTVEPDGTAHATIPNEDIATREEVEKVLDKVFGKE